MPVSGLKAPLQSGKSGPRIDIYYMESTGAGHRRAAEAVADALAQAEPGVRTELINIVDHMNDTLHRVYRSVRNWLMDDAPHVFGQLYSWADQPNEDGTPLQRAMQGLEHQSLRSLLEFMRNSTCDLAIHTHFFPAEIAAYLRRKQRIQFPHVTVTTDYFSHALWSQIPCERFFVASKEAARYLHELGVDPQTISETGIPIDLGFEAARPESAAFRVQTEARTRGLRDGTRRPHVLLSCTGVAPDAARRNLEELLKTDRPLEITVLAGGSDARKEALDDLHPHPRHGLHILGPRDDMPRLLAQADLAIGKAGGLTCAEAMAVGCPLAFLRPRPDQEAQNTEFILERQAGVRVFRRSLLPSKIEDVFGEPEIWGRLRHSAYSLGRPRAAHEVAKACLNLASRIGRSLPA